MGLFDLPAPLLAWLDSAVLGALPVAGRLAVWGALAGVLSMLVYWRLSAQERLAQLKAETAAARGALAGYDGELAGLWPLIGHSLRVSGRQIGHAAWPAVLASLPVLCVLAWLSGTYGYRMPEAGAVVTARVAPAAAPVQWQPPGPAATGSGTWRLSWPAEPGGLRLVEASETAAPVVALPLAAPIPVVSPWRWWNLLFGNPAGYIPAGAPVTEVAFDLQPRAFFGFGPTWVRGAEAVFLVCVVIASLVVKFVWRIH
jgi:hypothetical protein